MIRSRAPILLIFLLMSFLLLASEPTVAAVVRCASAYSSKGSSRHSIEVLEGQYKMTYDQHLPRSKKNKMIYLGGIGLSFEHSQVLANHLRSLGVNLIRVDMIGIGHTLKRQIEDSRNTALKEEISLDLQVKAVIEFIEGISSQPVHLVGLSYGGSIAASVAQARPDLVRRLMLVSPHVRDLSHTSSSTSTIAQWGDFMSSFNPMVRAMIDSSRRATLNSNFKDLTPEPLMRNQEEYLNAIFHLSEGVRNFRMEEVTASMKVETDLLYGQADRAITPSFFERAFGSLPKDVQGRFVELENAPHDITTSSPGFLAQWLFEGLH